MKAQLTFTTPAAKEVKENGEVLINIGNYSLVKNTATNSRSIIRYFDIKNDEHGYPISAKVELIEENVPTGAAGLSYFKAIAK